MAYDPARDGEWFAVPARGEKVACCDCGLVHRIKLSRRAGKPGIRFWRLGRETGGVRRVYGLRATTVKRRG